MYIISYYIKTVFCLKSDITVFKSLHVIDCNAYSDQHRIIFFSSTPFYQNKCCLKQHQHQPAKICSAEQCHSGQYLQSGNVQLLLESNTLILQSVHHSLLLFLHRYHLGRETDKEGGKDSQRKEVDKDKDFCEQMHRQRSQDRVKKKKKTLQFYF